MFDPHLWGSNMINNFFLNNPCILLYCVPVHNEQMCIDR
jgi:hypothetical protein